MRKRIKYPKTSVLLLLSILILGFKEPVKQLLSSLKSLSDFTSEEKVHLHLDKPYYVAGDNIWFKAYVLDEHLMEPSKISKVLYVDLLHKNNIVKTLKLPLENGIAWGDFKLSDSIPSGSYRIRAYTQWMRNAGESFFFDKTFAIGNETTSSAEEKRIIEPGFDVQFFPEGGRIVKGIPTKIAVRVLNDEREGIMIDGVATNINGETVSFTTNEMGLGYFMLNPISSVTQKANITFKNGARKEYSLPKIEESGYSLTLKTNGSLQIYMSADQLNKGVLSLVGQRNGNVYFVHPIPTTKQAASITIPVDKLPSGILQLSLYGADGALLSERFTFINHLYDKLDLNVEGMKTSYAKRSPVELMIDVKQQGLPVTGNFSMSVTNTSVIETDLDNETNILTSFLLNSDAISPIDGPNRYINQQKQQEVDLLMLTESWRSIPSKLAKERKSADKIFEPEKAMCISGTLTNNGKPVSNGKVTLMKSSGGFDILSTISNEQGKFRFDSLIFGDSTKLLIQARTSGDKKNVKILIDQIPAQGVTMGEIPRSNSDAERKVANYVRQSESFFKEERKISPQGVNQLKEVEITGTGRNLKENYVRFHLKADDEFTAKDLDSAAFLSQVLRGKIRGDITKYRVMLDGVYMSPTLFLLNIEPSSLERIEVVSSAHILAMYRSPRPILFATSKRFPTFSVKYAPGITTLTPKGFSYTREFRSPNYELQNDSRPDLRPTVYWNPNLTTDENGQLKIKYFNTDIPGKYRIVIEGIGGNRGLARKEIYYEVK